MKKTIRIMAVVMAVLMVTLVLASCGNTLSGKYSHTEGTIVKSTATFEFKGKNVTYTTSMGDTVLFKLEGTYEIKDDKITFDFTGEDESNNTIWEEIVDELTDAKFEKGDGYIKIAGTQFDKE